MGSQSEILFHEISDVQKILVGWTMFFFLALNFGRNSYKKHPVQLLLLNLLISMFNIFELFHKEKSVLYEVYSLSSKK